MRGLSALLLMPFRLAFWLVAGIVALVLATGVAAVLITPVLPQAAAPIGLALLVVLAHARRVARRRRTLLVLGYVNQAVRLNLPLSAMVQAAGQSERGAVRQRLGQLERQLETGRPLAQSLALAMPEMPRAWVGLVAAGERIGRLAPVLAGLLQRQRASVRREHATRVFVWIYPLMVLLILLLALGGISVFIMPTFVGIFQDFGVALPWQTLVTIHWTRSAGPWLVGLAIVAVLALAAEAVRTLMSARPVPVGFSGRVLWDHLIWATPVLGGLAQDRGLADALEVLEQGVDAGLPLPAALRQAQGLPVSAVLARRLRRWADDLEAGGSAAEAARRAGLPPLLAGLLSTGQATGDLRPVLGFLRTYYDSRHHRVASLLAGALVPATVLALGVAVGWVVFSVFLPLAVLIRAVVPSSALL